MAIYLLLGFLALFGFLPLAIILYKRNLVGKILRTGQPARARVYRVQRILRPPQDIVQYTFYDQNMQQHYGRLTTRIGLHKEGDELKIHYLPGNPRRNTIEGAWKSNFILGFGIAIAAFVLFAVYKLYEMIQSGEA
jgi:hypothetical protein